MNQPLYIAPDEEIISVIARLRSLPERTVTLVFPKHSVVTQSIINLKLLAREGEKLQKELTLVSQNENARSLAEKIGFATLPYTQEIEKGNLYLQSSATEDIQAIPFVPNVQAQSQPGAPEDTSFKPKSSDIGSQSFFTPVLTPKESPTMGDIKLTGSELESIHDVKPVSLAEAPLLSGEASATTLRIRNATPDRPPGLNSTRDAEASLPAPDLSYRSTVSPAIFPDSKVSPASGAPSVFTAPINVAPEVLAPTAIKDFFSRGQASNQSEVRMPLPKPASIPTPLFNKKADIPPRSPQKTPVMVGKSFSNKLPLIFVGFGALFVLAVGALGFFLVFPSASITIQAQTITDSTDQSYTLDTESTSAEIPLQKTSSDLTVKVAGIASGAAASASTKGSSAKGTIKITNNYSNEAQTLVSSTRFEAPDGKVYRIQQSVSVPGNGSVEAAVVADGSGESFNKNESTFTIPGFKGTDKYEKFSGATVTPLTGGGGEEVASGGTFIKADEETLRQRAAEEAKRIFTEEHATSSSDTYTFTEGLQVERITEANIPKVGSIPGEYEYEATFKVTAFTTSQDAVKSIIAKNIRKEYDNITFVPTKQELSFSDFSISEDGKQATMKAHLETTLAAKIDEDKIKADLAGKSTAELADFTKVHPEIKGLSITFSPAWALKRIPSNTNKIELITE